MFNSMDSWPHKNKGGGTSDTGTRIKNGLGNRLGKNRLKGACGLGDGERIPRGREHQREGGKRVGAPPLKGIGKH